MTTIVDELEALTAQFGFPLMGIARAQESDSFHWFNDWLEKGFHGTMQYLETRREAYRHPGSVLANCRSVIMLGMPYAANPETRQRKGATPTSEAITEIGKEGSVQSDVNNYLNPSETSEVYEAKVGNYAIGQVDYHDFIREKLNTIIQEISTSHPGATWRGVVDTAPLLERDYARLAGLGWVGKNTLLLNREWGSYFFLAAILTDLELPVSPEDSSDHCGSCTACLDACPTDAFPTPRVLDATRCISYLTIENKGEMPNELRDRVGDWIFGCDVCQIVCPWNRKRSSEHLFVFAPERAQEKRSLSHWLELDEEAFRKLYKLSPFWRTRLHGMQRNALIAAGNTFRSDLLPVIERLSQSTNLVVADAARWAHAKIQGEAGKSTQGT